MSVYLIKKNQNFIVTPNSQTVSTKEGIKIIGLNNFLEK